MNMSYDTSVSIGRPRALVHLATNSFFRMISKILPSNTSVVETCNDCNAVTNYQNHEYDEILNCKCYRFYRPVVELFLYLPSDLRKQTLEIAQKELDNSSSFRVLLGRLSIQCTTKISNFSLLEILYPHIIIFLYFQPFGWRILILQCHPRG